jgi:hypothetical protein
VRVSRERGKWASAVWVMWEPDDYQFTTVLHIRSIVIVPANHA